MIKALDALDTSTKSQQELAPEYWNKLSEKLSEGITRKSSQGKTFLSVRIKKIHSEYCIEKIKEYGYLVEVLDDSNKELTLIEISWNKD